MLTVLTGGGGAHRNRYRCLCLWIEQDSGKWFAQGRVSNTLSTLPGIRSIIGPCMHLAWLGTVVGLVSLQSTSRVDGWKVEPIIPKNERAVAGF